MCAVLAVYRLALCGAAVLENQLQRELILPGFRAKFDPVIWPNPPAPRTGVAPGAPVLKPGKVALHLVMVMLGWPKFSVLVML